MYGEHPRLAHYQNDWALQGFTTLYLKNAREKETKRGNSRKLDGVNAVLGY
jgi:hypothetical protein